jgi:hypothetical protein
MIKWKHGDIIRGKVINGMYFSGAGKLAVVVSENRAILEDNTKVDLDLHANYFELARPRDITLAIADAILRLKHLHAVLEYSIRSNIMERSND